MNKKEFALKHYKILNFFLRNKYRGKVHIINEGAILKKCKFISNGKNNRVTFLNGSFFDNCSFLLYGNNNNIVIGCNCKGKFTEFYIEDNNGAIEVGDNTSFCGKAHLAVIEGTKIKIGENCLFSSDIVLRTGDSHSILDLNGKRINPSKDIVIKNHVWVGHKVSINKNVTIEENTMIGTGAIVTKSTMKSNVIVAGVPAKIVKENINWDSRRLKIEK